MKENTKKILIVDDDHDIVHAIHTILSMESYKTEYAYSGKECLNYLKKQLPDLILLDYMLPDMTGRDIVEKIRQNPITSSLPIILISAAHGVEQLAKNLDIQDWIEKPFELDSLLKKVAKNL